LEEPLGRMSMSCQAGLVALVLNVTVESPTM